MELGSDNPIRVGVALAAYRPQSDYFVRQLETIEKQTYKNWICVITCDSHMEDIFRNAAIQKYKAHPRFRWYENENRLGCKKNFERAIRLCLDEGVCAISCSDQDDVWYPEKLECCVKELLKRPPLSLVHSDMDVLVMRGAEEVVLPETLWKIEARGITQNRPSHFLVRDTASGAAMLFDADLARRHPLIPVEFEYHDAWYAFLASAYGGVYPVRKALYAFRQHGNNELGTTPYRGLFSVPGGTRLGEVLRKCVRKYRLSKGMAQAALRENIRLSPGQKCIFLKPWDLGVGFLLMGLIHLTIPWKKDLPLARGCFARAIGKCLWSLKGWDDA